MEDDLMIIQNQQLEKTTASILTRSFSRKKGTNASWETTDDENAFFRELIRQTEEAKLDPNSFYFEPMSDEGFSVRYASYPIGKIKLRGKTSYMQVLKGLSGVKDFDNLPLEACISHIPEWIRRIKYCLRN